MKIKYIDKDSIVFDNGNVIHCFHCADCCEYNYAAFEAIDDVALYTDFHPELKFEVVAGSGFRFGNKNKMFFIPCYSVQNGYYSSDVEIYYRDEKILDVRCEVTPI